MRRVCNTCECLHDEAEFYDGECRTYRFLRCLVWRIENKERIAAAKREYRNKNIQSVRATQRRSVLKNTQHYKNYHKTWRKNNKERIFKQNQNKYRLNREHIASKNKENYRKNMENLLDPYIKQSLRQKGYREDTIDKDLLSLQKAILIYKRIKHGNNKTENGKKRKETIGLPV